MDTTETPQKVRFVHKKAENYQSYYANGVFGAVTGRGDFEMNFFFEHSDLPEEEMMNYVKGDKFRKNNIRAKFWHASYKS